MKEWGKRRLAYEINDFREGYYVFLNVNANSAAIDEFNRLSKINEDIVIRVRYYKRQKNNNFDMWEGYG